MAWRVASSLEKLLSQLNERFPGRNKDSDGGIGNAEHATRSSDHNPWVKDGKIGVVTARDFTHDPRSGCDSYVLAQALLDSRDPRIKFVISNRRIASGAGGPSPWKWRKYTGANSHDHHCHVSVREEKKFYDDTTVWDIDLMASLKPTPAARQPATLPPLLQKGSRGEDVRHAQQLLKITIDGRFGKNTETAVRLFQEKRKLGVDGRIGPQTWKALLGLS